MRRAAGTLPVLAATLIACTAYLAWHLARGWIPHDDGSLALSAERVLRGELPHRDFDELYTGGLAYFDALAFRLLGTTLMSLRWEMLAVFAAWIPALFYIARRFVPAPLAAGVAVLAMAWSVPNYNVPMPSWYNLFLATFGLAALVRHADDPRARWLAAAGLCAGLSFLVKSIGLYYAAGALLFLVFRAQASAAPGDRHAPAYAAFVTLALAAFVAVLALLVRNQPGAGEVFQHVAPGALIAMLLVRDAWRRNADGDAARFTSLMRLGLPFIAGVAIPVAIFLVPYLVSGAVGAFFRGVFVVPTRRLGSASFPLPPLWTAVAVLPLVALVLGSQRLEARVRRRDLAALGVVGIAVLVGTGYSDGLYRFVWWSIRNLLPIVVAGAAWILVRRGLDGAADARLFAVVAVAATCNLVQFPFAVGIYFCYVAPLVILAGVALAVRVRVAAPVLAALVVFYAAFAVLRLNTAPIYYMGVRYWPYPEVTALATDRARGIESLQQHAYVDRLAAVLREHARGPYIWASPDSPQVYYLAGFANPTRSFFEFFDEAPLDDEAVLRMLQERGITAVALNSRPEFSTPIRLSLYRELQARYPRFEDVGPYQVRWRE